MVLDLQLQAGDFLLSLLNLLRPAMAASLAPLSTATLTVSVVLLSGNRAVSGSDEVTLQEVTVGRLWTVSERIDAGLNTAGVSLTPSQ
jgi:hypothetical protein